MGWGRDIKGGSGCKGGGSRCKGVGSACKGGFWMQRGVGLGMGMG
jgi:hypothetical protein